MQTANSMIMGGLVPGVSNSSTEKLSAVTGGDLTSAGYYKPIEQYIRENKKVYRNDPCPCGAKYEDGRPKKYKHCCLSKGIYED